MNQESSLPGSDKFQNILFGMDILFSIYVVRPSDEDLASIEYEFDIFQKMRRAGPVYC